MTKATERDLWQKITSYDALNAAFAKVQTNGGSPGGDRFTIADFRSDLFSNINALRAELLSGRYSTRPFRKVIIPKKKPGYRTLTIPSIRDRVLHTAITQVLTPIFEPLFEDGSFAYRPNRGVVHAVARIEQWRNRGYDIVIEADIVQYFDNIDNVILKEKLQKLLAPFPGSSALLALLDQLLQEQANALGTPDRGLVQGSPLSPLLANLYLDALDEEIEDLGVKIVRFADDFVILCKSEKRAKKALQHCIKVLAEHNLQLHDDGTRIVNFDKGFDFIGYLFLRTLALKEKNPIPSKQRKPIKSPVTDEGIIELDDDGSKFDPGKRVLYVLDPDHKLNRRNRSFSVLRNDATELIAIPYRRVGRIEIGPMVQYTQSVVNLALESKIEIAIIDGFGQTKGTIFRQPGRYAGRHFAQAKAILNTNFRIEIAKKIVTARIHNQRTQLSRLNRSQRLDEIAKVLRNMKRSIGKVGVCLNINELRGIEGAATAQYWPMLNILVDDPWKVEKFRRQRPARDPVNATINYFTAVLERDIRASIHATNLHQGFAFLHGSQDRHDGLVYDFMEPFRAPLTEGLTVFLFNANRLRPNMFDQDGQGITIISSEGRNAIINAYESAVAKRVNRPDGNGKLAWRAMMKFQSQSLVRAISDQAPDLFTPYLMEA